MVHWLQSLYCINSMTKSVCAYKAENCGSGNIVREVNSKLLRVGIIAQFVPQIFNYRLRLSRSTRQERVLASVLAMSRSKAMS